LCLDFDFEDLGLEDKTLFPLVCVDYSCFDVTNFLAEEEEEEEVNMVCKFYIGIRQPPQFNFQPIELSLSRMQYEYADKLMLKREKGEFCSANIRVESRGQLKHVACNLFPKGNCVMPGATSAARALISANYFVNFLINTYKQPFYISNFALHNRVLSFQMGYSLDLEKLWRILGSNIVTYQPKKFPAARIRPQMKSSSNNNIVYLVYDTGKVVITGCKSKTDVQRNTQRAKKICSLFKLNVQEKSFSAIFNSIKERTNLHTVDQNLLTYKQSNTPTTTYLRNQIEKINETSSTICDDTEKQITSSTTFDSIVYQPKV